VVLDVINEDGTPNEAMAHSLRQRVKEDGTLNRSPTLAQWEFLKDLRTERFGAARGYPITDRSGPAQSAGGGPPI
jgi:hypothetical protein